MLTVPNWLIKNGHVSPPWVVSHCILHLFILKDGQVDLHLKAHTWTHWSMTAARCSHHFWVYRVLITSLYQNIHSLKKVILWENFQESLVLSVTGIIYHVHLSIECRHHQSFSPAHQMLPHPGVSSNHLHYRFQPKTRWLSLTFRHAPGPCFYFLLHDSICNSSMASLHHIYSHFYLCCSPGPINWTCQAEFNILCTGMGEPLFAWSPSKKQDGFPGCQDHNFGDSFFETILEHVSN